VKTFLVSDWKSLAKSSRFAVGTLDKRSGMDQISLGIEREKCILEGKHSHVA